MQNVLLENAEITFRNFAGRKGPLNEQGNREFAVYLPEDVAIEMSKQGWNIKTTNPRDEEDSPRYFVNVTAKLNPNDVLPGEVIVITSRGQQHLTEDTVGALDYAEIVSVDIIIRPYVWTYQATGSTGVKAMLKKLVVTINEDPLALKYADVPLAGQTPEG